MAEKRPRDYAREYQRRNDLAQQRGFRSYGQQRHYLEVTNTRAGEVTGISQEEVQEVLSPPLYNFDDYTYGDDHLLDAWIRRSEARGEDADVAYRTYMERSRGGKLSRSQVSRLAREEYGLDWDQEWASSL
jgi:hypothetical protein